MAVRLTGNWEDFEDRCHNSLRSKFINSFTPEKLKGKQHLGDTVIKKVNIKMKKGKVAPLHAIEAFLVTRGKAPTLS
jgi:hypothetical protein